jgi:hypothetical protein
MEETLDRPVDQGEQSLEAQARKRVRARSDFLVHLAVFLVANLGLIVLWTLAGRGYPWFLWVLIPWGMGLAGHGLTLLIGPESSVEERAIKREMARLRPRRQGR